MCDSARKRVCKCRLKLAWCTRELGLPSCDGVRPSSWHPSRYWQSLVFLQSSSCWAGLAVNNNLVASSSSCCTWIFSDSHNRYFLFPCVLDLSFAGANLYWLQLISLASCLPQGFLGFLIFWRKSVSTALNEFHNIGHACGAESLQNSESQIVPDKA